MKCLNILRNKQKKRNKAIILFLKCAAAYKYCVTYKKKIKTIASIDFLSGRKQFTLHLYSVKDFTNQRIIACLPLACKAHTFYKNIQEF